MIRKVPSGMWFFMGSLMLGLSLIIASVILTSPKTNYTIPPGLLITPESPTNPPVFTITPDFPKIALCNQLSGSITSSPINLRDFTGNEIIETFEPNFGRQLSPVTFHGVTYTSYPGTELWSDIEWGNQFDFSYFPDASGGFALSDGAGRTNLRIDFSVPVQRVGILVATSYITTYMMTACDDNYDLIGSVTATLPFESSAIFLGLQSTSNIRRVFITEPFNNEQITIFDDLRYESVP